MMIKESSNTVRCSIVGDGLVGKTSLVKKFARQRSNDGYVATVFDNFAGTMPVAGDKYTVSVYDTAGQQDHESLRIFTYDHSEVIIVCFSLTDRHSFNNVRDFWVPEIRANVQHKTSLILVATQSDAKHKHSRTSGSGNDATSGDDVVTEEEAGKLAEDIGAVACVECSAKDGQGINNLFENVVLSAIRGRKRKMSILKKIFGK